MFNRQRGQKINGWRKLARASWTPPSDPQFFGSLEIDAASMHAFCDEARDRTGAHVTMTHLVGRAVAHAMREVPEVSQRLAFGRAYPRESNDVFFIVTTDDGRELTGVKVSNADEKSAVQISEELDRRRADIDAGQDAQFGRTKRMLETVPAPLLRPAIRLSAWLTSSLNLDLPSLGLPRQAFGGAMVTSVGMWGISHAFSPLAAYYQVPVLVLVGAVEQKPVARQGLVTVRPVLTITATFDHRYVDGFQAARFAEALRTYCADPGRFEPAFLPVHSIRLAASD